MDQELINKLWQHTDQTDADNAARFKASVARFSRTPAKIPAPSLMPSSLFFKGTQDLFMSFHHEASNPFQHYHDFFELIYVCQGSPVGVINGQEIQLQEGSLSMMNPNAVHYFKQYSEATDLVLNIVLAKEIFQKSMLNILFSDPVLNAFFIRYQLENENQPSFLHLPQLDRDVDRLIEVLLREYLAQRLYSKVIIESLLTLIFSFILRIYTEKSSHENPIIADIMDYICQNYQNVQLESVAARFNYHPKYLSSLLHRQTGQTFRNLLTSIRLRNAVNYLIYTDSSVEQIAGLVGYKERSSFYGAFRKAYGTSPAEYRNVHAFGAARTMPDEPSG